MADQELYIKEVLDPAIKNSLFNNFSNVFEAIMELTDNAVSDRIIAKRMDVNIYTSKNKLTIVNTGGKGMDIKGLSEFASWGLQKARKSYDIGQYSQGGKAAMGYLGKSMVVITSPQNEKTQYRIEDFDLHNTAELKNYSVKTIEGDKHDGFVEVEVGGLRRPIRDEELEKRISDIYRALIQSEEVRFYINRKEIAPKEFPLDETFKVEKFSFDIDGNEVSGWVGRLSSRSGVKGGIRCYSKGRLISDREYFGHPDPTYKGTLNFLFGEVYLDFVDVNMNKTSFDKDSDDWRKVQEKMFIVLKPHVDELLGRSIEEPTEEEEKRVKTAREIMAILLKMKELEEKGASPIMEEEYGQKKPEPREEKVEKIEPENINKRDEYQPRTPAPQNAIGTRRRLRSFMDWEVKPMESTVRSRISVDEEGCEKLIINNIFPGFKAAKGNDLYLLETAALQLSKPKVDEQISVEDYLNHFDELYYFICSNLDLAKERLKEKGKKEKSD